MSRFVFGVLLLSISAIAAWWLFPPAETGFIWALEAPFLAMLLLFGARREYLLGIVVVTVVYLLMAWFSRETLEFWRGAALSLCSLAMAVLAAWILGRVAARSLRGLIRLGPLKQPLSRILIGLLVALAQVMLLQPVWQDQRLLWQQYLLQAGISVFGLIVIHCLAWPLLARPRRRWRAQGLIIAPAGLLSLGLSLAVYWWVLQLPELSGQLDPGWVLLAGLLFSATLCCFVQLMLENREALVAALRRENMAQRKSHRAHQQLEESRRMASLGAMVAGIAHEVNTPLNVAKLGLDNLRQQLQRLPQMGVQLPDEQRQRMAFSLNRVASNLDRAGELMNQFKDVSGNSTRDRLATVVVGVLLKKVRELMASRLDAGGAIMTWSGDLVVKLHTRPGQLSQVLVILVDNALTHAFAENAEDRRIDIRVKRSGGSGLRIVVADNGKGVPAEMREKIFERFVSTRKESGGNGLGLYLAHTIVHGQLNGQIRCESDQAGTRFVIDMPLALEEA